MVVLSLAVQQMFAQRTKRMNIEDIVSSASIIVRGTVTSVETKEDPETNILSTFVTISVKENFYGAEQNHITLKMLGGKSEKRTINLAEMPKFTVGEDIIGMFYAPSNVGFSSPVGMNQGKFLVTVDPETKLESVRNTYKNQNLFANLKNKSALAKSSLANSNKETIELSDFTQTVRSLVTILKK